YNLGMTRTSLPSAFYQWSKSLLHPSERKMRKEKQYIWALKNVSFDLNRGESMALIGPNGAGKTTILKLLANITRQTSGNIKINGKLSALIELGSGFHPDLSGRDNIFLNGTILGLKKSEIQQKFDEIVAFSELDQFIDTPVKRYSSGMAVRLGFSVAANIDPEILLVDEVLAVGDAAFRQKCMDRIRVLLNQGASIIFVSHNLWLVQAICQKAVYMEQGEIKFAGPTGEAIDYYDKRLSEQRTTKLQMSQSQSLETSDIIELTGIKINANRNERGEITNNERVKFDIHYNAYSNIKKANLVVRIVRSDGLTCCAIRTSLDDFNLSLKSGKGIISAILDPIQLYGGNYYVQAVFRDADDAHTITSGTSDYFYVKGSALSHQEMNGVFEPIRTWEHRSL
ncbi:ABC transporter ATP-binding protein, partial [Chloroflexota bacterium]